MHSRETSACQEAGSYPASPRMARDQDLFVFFPAGREIRELSHVTQDNLGHAVLIGVHRRFAPHIDIPQPALGIASLDQTYSYTPLNTIIALLESLFLLQRGSLTISDIWSCDSCTFFPIGSLIPHICLSSSGMRDILLEKYSSNGGGSLYAAVEGITLSKLCSIPCF